MEGPGLRIELHGARTAQALVLVHGAPDRSTTFRDVVPHLADRQVVTYDRRGYGRSLEVSPARSMRDHADDLLAIVETCGAPPVVVAHSFGSNLTMLAATLRPDAFAAIGLWEPPLPWVEWWPEATKAYNAAVAASDNPAADIEVMYRQLLGARAWDQLTPAAQDQRRGEGVAFQVDMASVLTAPFQFRDVLVPTLVGYGTATSDHHIEGARWLAGQLPRAGLHEITGAGHFAPRTHPVEFAKFVGAVVSLA
jgi:pimeloyl-ACP methyl ester carboxylesterase